MHTITVTGMLPFWLLEHGSLKLNSLVKIDGECVDHRSMGVGVEGHWKHIFFAHVVHRQRSRHNSIQVLFKVDTQHTDNTSFDELLKSTN